MYAGADLGPAPPPLRALDRSTPAMHCGGRCREGGGGRGLSWRRPGHAQRRSPIVIGKRPEEAKSEVLLPATCRLFFGLLTHHRRSNVWRVRLLFARRRPIGQELLSVGEIVVPVRSGRSRLFTLDSVWCPATFPYYCTKTVSSAVC